MQCEQTALTGLNGPSQLGRDGLVEGPQVSRLYHTCCDWYIHIPTSASTCAKADESLTPDGNRGANDGVLLPPPPENSREMPAPGFSTVAAGISSPISPFLT